MPGTVMRYQGYPAQSVVFRRSRGYDADISELVFPASAFPEGFVFATPNLGELAQRPIGTPEGVDALAQDAPPLPPLEPPNRLHFEGYLELAEVDSQGRTWPPEGPLMIGPLFVIRMETVRSRDDGSASMVRLLLADERYFWTRGVLRQWTFNRPRGDGSIATDSLRGATLQRWTSRDVSQEVVGSLFRQPGLAAWPTGWDKDRAGFSFRPWSPAVAALAQLVSDGGIEDPCLRLDSTVGLHRPGEGRVGYAPGGKGDNAQGFPPEVMLSKEGTGQGHVVEAGYPEELVLVTGGERVATVALDAWEPVLDLSGRIVPLIEETVRALTRDQWGLDDLHRFLTAPAAHQAATGLPPVVTQTFATQAYRLHRMPGAVVTRSGQDQLALIVGADGEEIVPLPLTGEDLAEESAGAADTTRRVADRFVGQPGRNAHLLPILDRAETVGGRRLGPTVEIYTFRVGHRAIQSDTDEQALLREVEFSISRAKREIQLAFARTGRGTINTGAAGFRDAEVRDEGGVFRRGADFLDRGGELQIGELFASGDLSPDDLEAQGGGAVLSLDDWSIAVAKARAVERVRAAGLGSLAAELDSLYQRQAELHEQVGGLVGQDEVYGLAKEFVELEKQAAEGQDYSAIDLASSFRNQGSVEVFKRKLEQALRRIAKERQDREVRERIGATVVEATVAPFVENLPRQTDADAVVYNAKAGVIRTSEMAVHIAGAEEGLPDPSSSYVVPRPVRVTFGAVVRPRTDVPQGRRVQERPRTGDPDPLLEGAEPDAVPEALTDRESYYASAWTRPRGSAEPQRVEVEATDLSQAFSIYRPDLVELVTLDGSSNRAQLDEVARTVAQGYLQRAEKAQTRRHLLGRAWPVQCDGVVAAVEIRSRANGAGFETLVVCGESAKAPPLDPMRTRVRPVPRREERPDAARREGL